LDTALRTGAIFLRKNQISRCDALAGKIAPNKIQGATGVASGGKDGVSHNFVGDHSDGNHRVPNLNHNSDGDWNFNLDNFENDWNEDNCFLCFCH
jgi:hypothetical protein